MDNLKKINHPAVAYLLKINILQKATIKHRINFFAAVVISKALL